MRLEDQTEGDSPGKAQMSPRGPASKREGRSLDNRHAGGVINDVGDGVVVPTLPRGGHPRDTKKKERIDTRLAV